MDFKLHKKNILRRKDKSIKGSIDAPLIPLIKLINNNPQYITTSSCSGRIIVWSDNGGHSKDKQFMYCTHTKADAEDIIKILTDATWLRCEPMILHINCVNLTSAKELLLPAQRYFKHSGIIALNKKITVEIRGSEFISAPLTTLLPHEYISHIVNDANKKMDSNRKKIEDFTMSISKIFHVKNL